MSTQTERRFSKETVLEALETTCENNHFALPCELDSWHGFESENPDILAEFGRHLESNHGFRFVGMWPSPAGSRNYHLRVARVGIYDEASLVAEVERLAQIATRHGVEVYADCSPQPAL